MYSENKRKKTNGTKKQSKRWKERKMVIVVILPDVFNKSVFVTLSRALSLSLSLSLYIYIVYVSSRFNEDFKLGRLGKRFLVCRLVWSISEHLHIVLFNSNVCTNVDLSLHVCASCAITLCYDHIDDVIEARLVGSHEPKHVISATCMHSSWGFPL